MERAKGRETPGKDRTPPWEPDCLGDFGKILLLRFLLGSG